MEKFVQHQKLPQEPTWKRRQEPTRDSTQPTRSFACLILPWASSRRAVVARRYKLKSRTGIQLLVISMWISLWGSYGDLGVTLLWISIQQDQTHQLSDSSTTGNFPTSA